MELQPAESVQVANIIESDYIFRWINFHPINSYAIDITMR